MVRRVEKIGRQCARAALLALLPALALAAPSLQVDSTKISIAAQDSTGTVWGIANYGGPGLYRWQENSWRPVSSEGIPSNATPTVLTRSPDGAVFCLWNNSGESHTVTRHQGDLSRQFASFTGHLEYSTRLFVDPKGNIWITENGNQIYRVTPEGKAEVAYTIPDDQFLTETRPPRNLRPASAVVSATADQRGRVWFWSESLFPRTGLATLRGVLIFDGEKFQQHPELGQPGPLGRSAQTGQPPQIGGNPYGRISVIAPADALHMWMAGANDQLYLVDINSLEATPVKSPEPGAFETVQKIFRIGEDTYLIAGMPAQAVPELSGGGRSGEVWRVTNGGDWRKVVSGLDSDLSPFPRSQRNWVSSREGLWLGAFGTGPWFIPARGGETRIIDWRYGYPLDGSERLFQLPDGGLLIISQNQGSLAVKPAELLAAYQSPSNVQTLNPYRELFQAPGGNIFGVLATADNALSEWDGRTWTKYALPQAIQAERLATVVSDSVGRVWLLPPPPMQTGVAIFDLQLKTFQTFPTYNDALQAQLPIRKDFRLERKLVQFPSFTADGRICYRLAMNFVWYFDGGRWRHWETNEITGAQTVFLDGPPFFDRAGNLAIHLQASTWEYTDQKGWQMIAPERGLGMDAELRRPPIVHMPSGCSVEHPESVVEDRLGTYWFTSRGMLYRAIEGLCVPQFAPEEHHPFIDLRKLREAFIDPKGNAFLVTEFAPNQLEYVIRSARPPLPQTMLRASVDPSGEVKLHFSTNVEGPAWFAWRMDGGPWSAATKDSGTTIEGSAAGKHRIEAAAIDARLQIDPTPAQAVVEVHVDTGEQIQALIQKLADPDYAMREKAVAALLRQPAAALPALRSARDKAGPDQRWWIDAAIQQIEDHLASSTKP